MPIRKNPQSGIWWIDLRSPSGQRIRRSAGIRDRKAAQEYRDRLKAELWRVDKLGETPHYTLDQAALAMLSLSEGQRDYDTKVRHVAYWRSVLGGTTPIRSLTAGSVGAQRTGGMGNFGHGATLCPSGTVTSGTACRDGHVLVTAAGKNSKGRLIAAL